MVQYNFSSVVWRYPGDAAWYFATLPNIYTSELKLLISPVKKGFGSIKVTANVGKTNWQTSIFPDSKSGSYLLPIKKEIRVKEKIAEGQSVSVSLKIIDKDV